MIAIAYLAAPCIPDLYHCIYGARCDALAIWRPHDRSHSGGVPTIGQDKFPRHCLPDLRSLVRRAGDDRAVIGRPAERLRRQLMAAIGSDARACGGVPDLNGIV